MARKPVLELAKEWFDHARDGDAEAMAELLADDALFYADLIRGKRFKGREEIESFLAESGFEAADYNYTAVDDSYVVVTVSLRRRLPAGGLADSTLAMVIKAEDDEIVCLDAFQTAAEAFRSLASR
jgi:uncharacterized protein (TIGR02246 family)